MPRGAWDRVRPYAVGTLAAISLAAFKSQPVEASGRIGADIFECARFANLDPASNYDSVACGGLNRIAATRQLFFKYGNLKPGGQSFTDKARALKLREVTRDFRNRHYGEVRKEIEAEVNSWPKNSSLVRGNRVVNNLELQQFAVNRAKRRALARTTELYEVYDKDDNLLYRTSGRKDYTICDVKGQLGGRDWVIASQGWKSNFDCRAFASRIRR